MLGIQADIFDILNIWLSRMVPPKFPADGETLHSLFVLPVGGC
jgi:hypothetical protein